MSAPLSLCYNDLLNVDDSALLALKRGVSLGFWAAHHEGSRAIWVEHVTGILREVLVLLVVTLLVCVFIGDAGSRVLLNEDVDLRGTF